MKSYSIGQISKLIGLSTKTIRFYEETGVISLPERAENGYRLYSDSTIEELRMLKYARDLGLPLSEIKKLMKGCDNGDCSHSKEYINTSIDNYLSQLSQKMIEMETLKTKLCEFKKVINTTKMNCNDGPYCCNILHQVVMSEIAKEGDTHGR